MIQKFCEGRFRSSGIVPKVGGKERYGKVLLSNLDDSGWSVVHYNYLVTFPQEGAIVF